MKYRELCAKLSEVGVSDFELEARLMLESFFGASPATIFAEPEREYASDALEKAILKRKSKAPLQYIFGEWELMGLKFTVNEGCLIPRPDTEILIERALSLLKKGDCVADLCTGSGCIGISLAKLGKELSWLTLLDISSDALLVARENVKRHGVNAELVEADLREWEPKIKYDMIVSNPPYIPTKDIDSLSDEVKNEPFIALDGGEDGLFFVRLLLDRGLSYLKDGGYMLIEFGYDQGEIIDTYLAKLKQDGKIKSYELLKDYGGNVRALCLQKE